jgi:hypothetical protein
MTMPWANAQIARARARLPATHSTGAAARPATDPSPATGGGAVVTAASNVAAASSRPVAMIAAWSAVLSGRCL